MFRTAKSLGIDAAGEGMSEVGTGIVQRFSNLVSGKTGKELASMSAKEIAIELLEDAPMEFAVGSTIGLGLSSFGIKERYKNHKYNARMLNYQADIISIGKQRISELAAIENPTAAEVEKSEILRSAIADRNVDKIEAVLSQEYLEQLQEAENDELTMEQWKEKISSDAEYTFTAEEDIELIAKFTKKSSGNFCNLRKGASAFPSCKVTGSCSVFFSGTGYEIGRVNRY